ncbi:hypothetical protein H4S08_003656 [Coemansia sp. RSA 1365]|nr:hypothetical protein H4S08_003656 [Coemansia sp. RSA 1365]
MPWLVKSLIPLGYVLHYIQCVAAQVPPTIVAASSANAMYNSNENTAVAITVLPKTIQQGLDGIVTITSVVDATTTETVHVTPQAGNNGNVNMIVVSGNSQNANSVVETVTSTQYVQNIVTGPTVTSYVFATMTATAYAPPDLMVVPFTNVVFWTKTVTKHVTGVVGQPIMTTAPPLLTPSIAQMLMTVTETAIIATTEIITTTTGEMQPTPLPTIEIDGMTDKDDEEEEDDEDDEEEKPSHENALPPVPKPSTSSEPKTTTTKTKQATSETSPTHTTTSKKKDDDKKEETSTTFNLGNVLNIPLPIDTRTTSHTPAHKPEPTKTDKPDKDEDSDKDEKPDKDENPPKKDDENDENIHTRNPIRAGGFDIMPP